MKKKASLYGEKPKQCPASASHCGKCNVYPCLMGSPPINEKLLKRSPATDEAGNNDGGE